MRLVRFISVLVLVAAICPPLARADDASITYNVQLRDSPRKGPAGAKITIVEFGDFQCPFCARSESTMAQLATIYADEIRFVFKQNPLAFHQHAQLAAEASLAAGEQGKFWEFHDLVYANQAAIEPADLEKYAQRLGLDATRFKSALDSHRFKSTIDRDQEDARLFQATGTPTFFINGRLVKGAVSLEKFEAVIDQEMKRANAALAAGTSRSALYEALVKGGKLRAEAPVPDRQAVRVSIGSAPQKGAATAKITVVEWADFQCPFCARAAPTIERLFAEYPGEVRLVFKHNPLPFHPDAMPAALAAEAAKEQGKFWEFYSLAYSSQKELSVERLDEWAKQLGLDLDRFHKTMNDPATKAHVQSDLAEGVSAGVKGTPTFFVNGRLVTGAQPFEKFKDIADEEVKKANAFIANGMPRGELYDRLVGLNVTKASKPPPAREDAPVARIVAVPLDDSADTGPATALVTIVEFSDFQCPFCGRVIPTLRQLMQKHGRDLRIVFKHNPLPFHTYALLASEAALAAGEQGKFWEMHDLLFDNQQALEREHLEEYATRLHLDMTRFRSALDSHRFQEQIKRDQALAASAGANGTPTFFINGRLFVGAQPFDSFEKVIVEEKAHAQKLLSQGTPANSLYEAALKDAHAEPPVPKQPPVDDGERDGEPLHDGE